MECCQIDGQPLALWCYKVQVCVYSLESKKSIYIMIKKGDF